MPPRHLRECVERLVRISGTSTSGGSGARDVWVAVGMTASVGTAAELNLLENVCCCSAASLSSPSLCGIDKPANPRNIAPQPVTPEYAPLTAEQFAAWVPLAAKVQIYVSSRSTRSLSHRGSC